MRIFTSENSLAVMALVFTLLLIALGVFEYQTKDFRLNASEADAASGESGRYAIQASPAATSPTFLAIE